MNELVERLSHGSHPVTVGGPRPSLTEFHQRVTEMGYVFIKFTDTRGGTDLGMRVEKERTDLSMANIEHGTGIAHVEGKLTLNSVHVRCIAEIELATLNGTGHLVIE